ncbi:MAG: precorrin-8X methylmutase [Bacillota bacterium]
MRNKLKPMEIEQRSMQTIASELGTTEIPSENRDVVMRVIHTTAEFDYVNNLVFSEDACKKGIEAIKNGAHIVTDTKMAMAGINKAMLGKFGGEVHCFIGDADVATKAKQLETTRAEISMEKAKSLGNNVIYAIGNAPTALFKLRDMIDAGEIQPALIIGVPVGFVNVVESKEEILQTNAPHIVAKGRKGGSNVAAAIVNALMYQVCERE